MSVREFSSSSCVLSSPLLLPIQARRHKGQDSETDVSSAPTYFVPHGHATYARVDMRGTAGVR
eukprot:4408651-Prymnesium_polylepis.1